MAPLMEATQSLQLDYPSAPSSPRTSHSSHYYYTSAPASPSRVEFSFDLSFGFNGGPQFCSADELFEGGMVRPFMTSNPNPPHISSSSSRFLHLEKEEKTSKESSTEWTPQVRGRTVSSLSTTRTDSQSKLMARPRSLSPIRRDVNQSPTTPSSPVSKKWRLKDFFLFRSASEGRATSRGSKDPLRSYTFLSSDNDNYSKAGLRRKGKEKFRTPLPFHQSSLFGYLRFNPAINSISRRFNGCSNEGSGKKFIVTAQNN